LSPEERLYTELQKSCNPDIPRKDVVENGVKQAARDAIAIAGIIARGGRDCAAGKVSQSDRGPKSLRTA